MSPITTIPIDVFIELSLWYSADMVPMPARRPLFPIAQWVENVRKKGSRGLGYQEERVSPPE
jgi:hypothetical protein